MPLMYNALLVSNLIICQLNIFVLLGMNYSMLLAKNVFSIIVNYQVKCLQKIFYNSKGAGL